METFSPDDALLKVKDLRVYYTAQSNPVRAVDGVTFNVKAGEIFSIVGESGCGKSTLANTLIGLLDPPAYLAGGEVILKGLNILDLDEEGIKKIRWKEISILPQSAMNALNPVMKIYDQIKDTVAAHDSKISDDDVKSKAEAITRKLMLPSYTFQSYPCQLSGGMRQRSLLLLSYIMDPSLVIIDEPTSAVDVVTQRKILEFLRLQRDESGTSVILITHDIAVTAQVANRMMVMYAGKVFEIGDVKDVFKEPLHPYSKALIDAVPLLGVKREIKGLTGLPPDLRNPPSGCRFHPRCPNAMKICEVEEPQMKEPKPNHLVACHLYGEA